MLRTYEAKPGERGAFSEWRRKQSDTALAALDAKIAMLLKEGADKLNGSNFLDEVGGGVWKIKGKGKPELRAYFMKGPGNVETEITFLSFAKKDKNAEVPQDAEAVGKERATQLRNRAMQRVEIDL